MGSIVGDVARVLQHHHVVVERDDEHHHRHHQQPRSLVENFGFLLNPRKLAEHQDCSRGWLQSVVVDLRDHQCLLRSRENSARHMFEVSGGAFELASCIPVIGCRLEPLKPRTHKTSTSQFLLPESKTVSLSPTS